MQQCHYTNHIGMYTDLVLYNHIGMYTDLVLIPLELDTAEALCSHFKLLQSKSNPRVTKQSQRRTQV